MAVRISRVLSDEQTNALNTWLSNMASVPGMSGVHRDLYVAMGRWYVEPYELTFAVVDGKGTRLVIMDTLAGGAEQVAHRVCALLNKGGSL